MSAYGSNSKLAAYKSVSVHGTVAAADPHRLVLMLMDGVMERLAMARACIERRDIAHKAKLLHSCVTLLTELRGSLNISRGGDVARNLSELYDYMMRQLMRANAESKIEYIKEVSSLLGEVRDAWTAIGPEVRQVVPAAMPAMAMR
ncbi:MAG TPA: flagellar export chaperone FliS [Steroidobacteraceae bacterium]|nr:flagellar export chaperone FliS [Steroidobacteraceae bacterium]